MNPNIIVNDYTEIELKDGVIYIYYKDMSIITLREAKIIANDTIMLCNGVPRVFIIDGTGVSIQMNNEARNYFANHPPYIEMGKAIAIVIDNMATSLLAKFYIKYHKPIVPTKIFSKLKDAEYWVQSLPE